MGDFENGDPTYLPEVKHRVVYGKIPKELEQRLR